MTPVSVVWRYLVRGGAEIWRKDAEIGGMARLPTDWSVGWWDDDDRSRGSGRHRGIGHRRRRRQGGFAPAGHPGDPQVGLREPHVEGPGLLRTRPGVLRPGHVGDRLYRQPAAARAVVGRRRTGGVGPVHHRPRRRPRGAVQEPPAQLDRRPRRHAAVVARVRGLGVGPQPHPPRSHRARGHGLRLASGHPGAVRRHEPLPADAPPGGVVLVGRRLLLPARDLVQQDDHVQPAGQVGQGHPPRHHLHVRRSGPGHGRCSGGSVG